MEDDFAQSREPDDLFADEIEPALEENPEKAITGHETHVSTSANSISTAPSGTPLLQQGPNGRGGRSNRGGRSSRGGNRGGQTRGNRGGNIPQVRDDSQQKESQENSDDKPAVQEATSEAVTAQITLPVQGNPTVEQEQRVTSVRGDRSATGPAKPVKRTDAELNELMSSMRLKNVAKTEAHERAEKDQASYLQRERQAAAKKVEERKAMRIQDVERAKNRERKIKAQGVREWDSEKIESDIVDRKRGSSSAYMRGAHGAVAGSRHESEGLASSRYSEVQDAESFERTGNRGRERGARRGRGGRGRGGGRGGSAAVTNAESIPNDQDFPALPIASTQSAIVVPKDEPSQTDSQPSKPVSGLGQSNWADEMETPSGEQA